MTRIAMLSAILLAAAILPNVGCRSCGGCEHDYDAPVRSCECDAYGTHRCGSACCGCTGSPCVGGGCMTGDCATGGCTTGGCNCMQGAPAENVEYSMPQGDEMNGDGYSSNDGDVTAGPMPYVAGRQQGSR